MKCTSRLLWVLLAVGAAFGQTPEVTAFEHARIIDGTGSAPRENATLLIMGQRVIGINSEVPQGARHIDAGGKTIIPGLINAHGHLGVVEGVKTSPDNYTRDNVARQLEQYARYGVTAVLSLGLNRDLVYDLRDQQKRGDLFLDGATLFTAGRGIGVPGGAPPMDVGPDQVYRPNTPQEARLAVREMASHQPDMIKVWVDDIGGTKPKMKPEIYRAAIDEAHKNHLRAAAHVYYLKDAKLLVDAGIDVLAHSVRDAKIDSELQRDEVARRYLYPDTGIGRSLLHLCGSTRVDSGSLSSSSVGPPGTRLDLEPVLAQENGRRSENKN